MFWINLKKNITDPKVIIFVITLFTTNGLQAYFNVGESVIKKEPTKEIIPKGRPHSIPDIKVIVDCNSSIIEHEKEHHGRI